MSKRLRSPHIWTPTDTVEANAALVLPGMAHDYFAAGREVVTAKTAPEDLHPFRLATKRFRYTLETFGKLYGSSMNKKLELLKPVQDALGDVNDCVATRDAFKEGKKFSRFLDRRSGTKAREFRRVWKKDFDAKGQEEMWVLYLSKIPASGSRKAKSSVHRKRLPRDKSGRG